MFDAINRVDLAPNLWLNDSARLSVVIKNLLGEDIYYLLPLNTYGRHYLAIDESSVMATLQWSN